MEYIRRIFEDRCEIINRTNVRLMIGCLRIATTFEVSGNEHIYYMHFVTARHKRINYM